MYVPSANPYGTDTHSAVPRRCVPPQSIVITQLLREDPSRADGMAWLSRRCDARCLSRGHTSDAIIM